MPVRRLRLFYGAQCTAVSRQRGENFWTSVALAQTTWQLGNAGVTDGQ
jgi:hypothetical protein